ncbi:hypothetical protein JCM10207_006012 [Rhodosporidiobolus poonsookiae]
MFEPVYPPSPPSSPPFAPGLSSFTFPLPARPAPPAPSSPLPQPPTQQSDSVFRLDRPHALPKSYLAVRDSLTQQQVQALTAEFAAALPASWGGTAASPASSPDKEHNARSGSQSEASETAVDPEEWARQRRLSSILSGLGMVLGSVSLSLSLSGGGVLQMQDEEPEKEQAAMATDDLAQPEEADQVRSQDPSPMSTRTYVSASPSMWLEAGPRFSNEGVASGEECYESAEEGEERAWLSRRSSRSSMGRPPFRPRKSSSIKDLREYPATLATILDNSPLVPSSSPLIATSSPLVAPASPTVQAASPEVSFGYACGGPIDEEVDAGAEADDDDDDGPASSVGQLVRRSWRLSRSSDTSGAGFIEPAVSPEAIAAGSAEKHDDGLGLNFELLNFANGGRTVRTNAASTYTPSSRPLSRVPVFDAFPETTQSPVSAFLPELPASPPLTGGVETPALPTSSNLAPPTALSPIPSIPDSPIPPDQPAPPPASTTLSGLVASRSPQPRSSSLNNSATNLSSSQTSTSGLSLPQPRARRQGSDNSLNRRKSIGSSLTSSKSSRRLSALITTGMGIVRSRTSSHNSVEDGDEQSRDDLRASRRRSRTDGLLSGPISAPLPSQPFPPAPPIRRSATPEPRPASTRPSPSPASSARSSFLPSTTPSLTQSPLTNRTWRSTLSEDEYEQLVLSFGALEMRRQEVIWELCETERSFVNGLRGVIQVFTLPLRTRSGAWIRGVPVLVSRLLDWLDDIVYLHNQISAALDAVREKQYPVVLKLADALLPFVQRLEVHQPYLVRFEAVTRSIDEMTADPNDDFGEFVRMQSSLPECGSLSLSSFLLKPVQRLMKYPLFFKQLCDLTPTNHPDHFNTLTLLHSTDSMIRVMQEVKTREDEYDEAKVLQSRIRGLPDSFQLAARDRRLVAHGVLRRVHVNDRDRGVLEMDAIARAGRRGAALRGGAPIPPSLTIPPQVDLRRPESTVSDSGSSSVTDISVPSSAGLTPPTTPGSALPTSPGFSQLRPDSMVSNASSVYSEDFAAPPSAFSTASTRTQSAAHQQRLVKTKAKESSVHVFVFSDLIVLATKHVETSSKFMRNAAKGGSGKERESPPTYRALEGVGVARVLGVSDLSGKTEHDHLIEVDLLPILKGQNSTTPLSLSNTSLATSVYFTLPPPSSARSPMSPSLPSGASSPTSQLFKDRLRWLQAFERSYLFALRSLSFPSQALNSFTTPVTQSERMSVASYISAGIVPKSPSEQALNKLVGASLTDAELAEQEREERGWWAVRLKQVRKELEGTMPALGSPPAHAAAWAPASSGKASQHASVRRGGGGGAAKAPPPVGRGGNAGLGIRSLGFAGGMGRRASG